MGFKKKLKKLAKKVVDVGKKAVDVVTRVVSVVTAPVQQVLAPALQPVEKVMAKALQPVTKFLQPLAKHLAPIARVLTPVAAVAQFVVPGIGTALATAARLVGAVANLPAAVAGGVKGMIANAVGGVLGKVGAAVTAASGAAGKVIGAVTGVVGAAQSGVQKATASVQSVVQKATQAVTAPVREALAKVLPTRPTVAAPTANLPPSPSLTAVSEAAETVGDYAGPVEAGLVGSAKAVGTANFSKVVHLNPSAPGKLAGIQAATDAKGLQKVGVTANSATGKHFAVLPAARVVGAVGTAADVVQVGADTLQSLRTSGPTAAVATGVGGWVEARAVGSAALAGAVRVAAVMPPHPVAKVAGGLVGGVAGALTSDAAIGLAKSAASALAARIDATPLGGRVSDALLAARGQADALFRDGAAALAGRLDSTTEGQAAGDGLLAASNKLQAVTTAVTNWWEKPALTPATGGALATGR